MSEAATLMPTRAKKGKSADLETAPPPPPPKPAGQVAELKASAHLMTLDDGVFCIVRQGPPANGHDDHGLPAVRVSLPPSLVGAPTNVSISTFRSDGWLGAGSEAAMVRVTGGPAQLLVTVYQLPQHGPESAPRIQVLRVAGEVAPPAAPVPGAKTDTAAAPAAEDSFEMVAHIQRTGDVKALLGEWMGSKGSKLWIEGFGLVAPSGIAPEELEYQAVLGRGWLSPWVTAGKFCGSRGMALPLLGLRIRLTGEAAKTHSVTYSASFTDGSLSGPASSGEPCEAESLAPLEAFQILIAPLGAETARPEAKPAKAPARTQSPPPAAKGGSAAKRGR
jgi:hypothetical protein